MSDTRPVQRSPAGPPVVLAAGSCSLEPETPGAAGDSEDIYQ